VIAFTAGELPQSFKFWKEQDKVIAKFAAFFDGRGGNLCQLGRLKIVESK